MRAAIILAAGASQRFGRRDKLREQLGGRTLLAITIVHARAAGVRRIIVVGGRTDRARDVVPVRCPIGRKPLAASVAAGLAALRPIEREALIFLADMPFATAPRLRLAAGTDLVRPSHAGKPGHPVLVRVAPARALLSGGGSLATMAGQRRVRGTADHVTDVDTVRALRAVRYRQPSLNRRKAR